MVHVHVLEGFFDSIWGFVQALSAVIMVVFTVKLFRVTDKQRLISERQASIGEQANAISLRQQELMEAQNKIADQANTIAASQQRLMEQAHEREIDMKCGVLEMKDCYVAGPMVRMSTRNIGMARLKIYLSGVVLFKDRYPAKSEVLWTNENITIEPDQQEEFPLPLPPDLLFGKPLPNSFPLLIFLRYVTLGLEREAVWLGFFNRTIGTPDYKRVGWLTDMEKFPHLVQQRAQQMEADKAAG